MIRSHKFHTGSPLANKFLNEWKDISSSRFIKIIPKAMDTVDVKQIYQQQITQRIAEMEFKK